MSIERVRELISRIEAVKFECEAGPLHMCRDWIDLKALIAPEVNPAFAADGVCSVCGAKPAIGVETLFPVPDEYSYCAGCLTHDAVPYAKAVQYIQMHGGMDDSRFPQEFLERMTYVDGDGYAKVGDVVSGKES